MVDIGIVPVTPTMSIRSKLFVGVCSCLLHRLFSLFIGEIPQCTSAKFGGSCCITFSNVGDVDSHFTRKFQVVFLCRTPHRNGCILSLPNRCFCNWNGRRLLFSPIIRFVFLVLSRGTFDVYNYSRTGRLEYLGLSVC